MIRASNSCPITIAVSVDVVPILGIRKIGVANITIPNTPPRKIYHSFACGMFLKLAVFGKISIITSAIAKLTTVKIRTDPRAPVLFPKAEFKTLWTEINDPAKIPKLNKRNCLIFQNLCENL